MTTVTLTIEYIASQINVISTSDLIDLIEEYANQKADEASYWAEKNHRD